MIGFTLTLTGSAPLLMHNARLADPLDPITKEMAKLNSKRKKTEDDYQAIAHTEFLGGLYLDPDVGPYIPGPNITACLVEGAKLNKLGATTGRGLLIETEINPLGYKGPRDAEEMWKSKNFTHRASIKVGRNRVMRIRPIFREWSVACEGVIDESQLDLDQLGQIADNAGAFCGLGDWRPSKLGRFGRFTAKVERR